MNISSRGDLSARVIGMLVFLIGIVLLVVVFYTAFRLFSLPSDTVLGLTFTGDPRRDPSAAVIGTRFGWLFARIAFLFVMSIAGSLVAQRGVGLYFGAIRHQHEPNQRASQSPSSASEPDLPRTP